MIIRRTRKIALLLLPLLLAAGIAAYDKAYSSPPNLDLSVLSAVAPAQKYESLETAVQSNGVPAAGFCFAVLGDTRSNLETAEKVLARSLEEKPLFILHTGDIISKGLPNEFLAHHMKLVDLAKPVPIIPVPGNHEKGPTGTYAVFNEVYGGLRFCFDYGGCRFVGIPDDEKTGIQPEDMQFLQEKLEEAGPKYRFVMTHTPPMYVTTTVAKEDGRGFTVNEDEFQKLVERTNTTHVFLGHIHGFGSATIDGIPYTVTGGGGANLTDRLKDEAKAYNFVIVHVTPENVRAEAFILRGDQWVEQPL